MSRSIRKINGKFDDLTIGNSMEGPGNIKWIGNSQATQSVIDSCPSPAADNLFEVLVPPGHENESYTNRDYVRVTNINGSRNVITVPVNQTVEAEIASCLSLTPTLTNPYVVKVPPGVHDALATITLPPYVDIEGMGRKKAQLKADTNLTSEFLVVDSEVASVKNLYLKGKYGKDVDLLVLKNTRQTVIENVFCDNTNLSGLVFDHPTGLVSRQIVVRDVIVKNTRESCIRNKGAGYARVYMDGLQLSAITDRPAAHGIEGHFIGSIKNVRMSSIGGDHLHLSDIEVPFSITDCHFEGARSKRSMYLANCRNVHIKNITMWGYAVPYKLEWGVYLVNCHNCTVENVVTAGSAGDDTFVAFYADADSENNVFKNNIAEEFSGNQVKYDVSAGNRIEDTGEEVTAGTVMLQHWSYSELNSAGGAITATLPDGTWIGQRKTIVMIDATASSTVSCTHHVTSDPEIATFDDVDETWILEWMGTEWVTIYASCTFV